MYPLFCVFRDIAMRFVSVFECGEFRNRRRTASAAQPTDVRGKAAQSILYTQKKYEKIAHGNGASKLRIAKVRVIIK